MRIITVTLRSLAKINLDLRVLDRRPDGYHNLRTVFQTVSLADRIHIDYTPARRLTVDIRANVDIPGDNLIAKAAQALAIPGRFDIRLDKRIPMGGGLGGGSSNAAAMLLAIPALTGRRVPLDKLIDLAASLGSDVPFFLLGGTAGGLDRGAELYPLPDSGRLPAILVAPQIHVSTAAAYAALDAHRSGNPPSPSPHQALASPPHASTRETLAGTHTASPQQALAGTPDTVRRQDLTGTPDASPHQALTGIPDAFPRQVPTGNPDASPHEALAGTPDTAPPQALSWTLDISPPSSWPCRNDFEAVVFAQHRHLKLIKGKLLNLGADLALMSGSGSTLFGLFANRQARDAAVVSLRKDLGKELVFPVSTVSRGAYHALWRRQLRIPSNWTTWPPQNR